MRTPTLNWSNDRYCRLPSTISKAWLQMPDDWFKWPNDWLGDPSTQGRHLACCWCSWTVQSPRRAPSLDYLWIGSQATPLPPNPQGFCSPLADCNTGALSPEVDLLSRNHECISIYNNWVLQPEGITFHFRFPSVVNDSVVDMKCSLH